MKGQFKCDQPGCSAEYNDKAHLGIHRRAAHGIAGQSANAIKHRELRHAAKAAQAAEAKPTKRKYTKRSNSLATIPQETNGHVNHSNGQTQALSRRFHAEAALAVAYGRFQALCASVCFEYDFGSAQFCRPVH